MEVILKQDSNYGKAGNVIKVKDGFARNFLIPRGLAMPSTSANLKKLEQDKLQKAQEQEKLKKQAEELKAKLAGLSLTLPVLAQEEDKIYGSISVQEIAKALAEEGLEIEKSAILLSEPLKALGIYEVEIKLHPEVSAKVKIWIVKK